MAKSGDVRNPASPPFATPDGKPMAPQGGYSGAHDFLKDPKSHAPATGGRDFTKESRPQSEAEARSAGNPNADSIPSGGKDLKADPGAVSKNIAGMTSGVTPPKPFKLKG